MTAALHHALLLAACLALAAAGHRVAASLTDRLAERIVAAFVLAAAAAVIEALVLGLVGLGADPAALGIAAGLTLAAAHRLWPAPSPPSRHLAAAAWAALGRGGRAAAGALAGLGAGLLAWPLHAPVLGFDGVVYHLPEIARWVANGRPGSIVAVSHLFPFANYPVVNEVALTWASGIAASLVPLVMWSAALLIMAGVAGASALCGLGVGRGTAILAVAAVLATPVIVEQLATPSTDLAGLCWLACAAALTVGARERPGLAAPALAAAGLAVGSKTSTLPLALAIVGLLVWRARPTGRFLVAGLVLAALLAGPWPVRNLLAHGSPLWPFRSLPWGDPVPHVWALIEPSLLSRPSATLSGHVGDYADVLAGALLLAAAAPLAWIVSRRRDVVIASALAALALAAWVAAPSTGAPDTPVFSANPISATRYAIPAIAAAATALALAGSSGARLAPLAKAVLAGALVWNLVGAMRLDAPFLPPLWAAAVAGAAGAACAVALGRVRPATAPGRPARILPAAAVACLLTGAALGAASGGLIARQAVAVAGLPGTDLATWARSRPGFGGASTIAFTGTMTGQLAGERLQHRLELVPAGEPCEAVRARTARGLVVVADDATFEQLGVATAAHCLDGLRPVFEAGAVRAYGRL